MMAGKSRMPLVAVIAAILLGLTVACGSATPGLIEAILGSFQEVMTPWYISASTLPLSLRWVAGRRPGTL